MTNDIWQPMDTAPKTLHGFRALMADGTIHDDVHWAEDMSGSDQPPFRGWFIPVVRDGKVVRYQEIEKPVQWMPRSDA